MIRTHATPHADEFTPLVGDIYDAALEPERWRELLPRLVRFVGGERGVIGLLSPEGKLDISIPDRLDPAHLVRWQSEFDSFDPFISSRGSPPTGAQFRLWEFVPRTEIHRMNHYRGLFREARVDDQLVVVLPCGSFFSAYRGETEGRFNTEDIARHALLSPHLVRAAQIHERLLQFGALRESAERAFDLLPFALFLLSEAGRIVCVNAEGERLLAERDALASERGRLVSLRPASRGPLERAIAGARIARDDSRVPRASTLRIERIADPRPLQVLTAPVTTRANASVFGFARDAVTTLVIASDPSRTPRLNEETLREALGVTPALARLAAALARGETLTDYADRAHVTEGTVRQQVKDLLARTGTHRQSDLVRLVLSSLAQLEISRLRDGES